MSPVENICSLCMRTYVKFYHLKDSIRAPIDLHFEGHRNLQAVLQKILNKKGEYRKASNEICQNCRDKLHGIYSFMHQHSESEKIFHQITDATVRLKRLKTFFILTDLNTEFEAIAETDKNVVSPECSSTAADVECDGSDVSKVVVKNEFGNSFEGTDFRKLIKEISVGLLEGKYSNTADTRSVEQKKINSIGNADSEQITIEEEIIKEEWTMQEGEIFEAKAKRDILGRKQTKFSCDVCDEVFATVSCLSEHTRIVHENDSHNFNQADAKHNTEKEEHSQRLGTRKKFACNKCDAKYKHKRSLWDHKKTHIRVTLKCNKCDLHFHGKHALGEHKRAHGAALLECDMCDAEFKYKSNLEKHKLSHTNELLGCKYCCNSKFTTKASLRHHRLSRICKSCKCVQCDVKLSNRKTLRQHLKMVHSDTNYSCDQCEKKFKYKNNLKVHEQSHTGVVIKCVQCDAKLSSKKNLRQHLKMVHSITNYFCDQCDKKFKYKYSLRVHKQWHAGVVFKCDHCDANYKRKQSLNRHKKIHSGILFNCNTNLSQA